MLLCFALKKSVKLVELIVYYCKWKLSSKVQIRNDSVPLGRVGVEAEVDVALRLGRVGVEAGVDVVLREEVLGVEVLFVEVLDEMIPVEVLPAEVMDEMFTM